MYVTLWEFYNEKRVNEDYAIGENVCHFVGFYNEKRVNKD